jgi:hypothetical protein
VIVRISVVGHKIRGRAVRASMDVRLRVFGGALICDPPRHHRALSGHDARAEKGSERVRSTCLTMSPAVKRSLLDFR